MNDFLKVLLNIRSLRAAVRDLPFEQLQEIKEKFDTVVQEQLKAAEVDQAAKLEHEKKLAEFRELLAIEGISPEVHIPADHEHQFRFNVNTISGPM